MGIWADVVKVMRGGQFKKELKNGQYSVKNADYATNSGTSKRVSVGTATTSNKARGIWFSDSDDNGKAIIKSSDFNYNPITKTQTVQKITGISTINGKEVSSFARIETGLYTGDGNLKRDFPFVFSPVLFVIQPLITEGESAGEFSYYEFPYKSGQYTFPNGGLIWSGENGGPGLLSAPFNLYNGYLHDVRYEPAAYGNTITIIGRTQNKLNSKGLKYRYFVIGY